MLRSRLCRLLLAIVLVLLASRRQALEVCPPAAAPPAPVNRDGAFLLFEESPLHPIELSADGRELWVANIPDARVSVLSLTDPTRPELIREIPVGLGPVALHRRPGSAELWVVCQSSNSVVVIDMHRRRVVDSVHAAFEPTDLAFDPAGATAWITLSASRELLRVDAATRLPIGTPIAVATRLGPPYDTLAPVEEPRTLLLAGEALFVLSHRSGNGTSPDKLDADGDGVRFEVVDRWRDPSFAPPPDRDVLRLDLAHPEAGLETALWRMGTLGFGLERGPDGTLFVANVELQNAERSGRDDLRRRGFARHRISRARPRPDGRPQDDTVHVDLNVDRHPALPAGATCAGPNALALSRDARRLFVACYETRNTMVVDTARDQVVAVLDGARDPARGFGPRGVVLNENAGLAYVYNRADNTVQSFRLPAEGRVEPPLGTVAAGLDPTPQAIKNGRRHFIDARNSAHGTASCNTCHTEGQPDGLAWDLGDRTGDLDHTPHLRDDGRDARLTQDLRNVEATPPYHWQGNRADLADFNPAFERLLGGRRLTPAELRELEAYVFALALPPNPAQPSTRTFSPRALAGHGCFAADVRHPLTTHTPGIPALGGAAEARVLLSCQSCHTPAGGLYTNNQLVNDARFPVPRVTPQLRGLFDRPSARVEIAGTPWPAAGWGLGGNGSFADVDEFIAVTFPTVSPEQNALLVAFLRELDSGMAPATAFAWTLSPQSARLPMAEQPPANYSIPQTRQGNADLIARGWLAIAGREVAVGLLYDPASDRFRSDHPALGPFSYPELVARVAGEGGGLLFLGTPVGMGYRLGLDRDLDFLLDGEESAHGASSASADSDGDGFPDGYEVRLGSAPNDADSRPHDTKAPVISELAVAWTSASVADLRWRTDEETTATVRVLRTEPGESGAGTLVWEGESSVLSREHAMVVRGLAPARRYVLEVEARDAARPANLARARLGGERTLQTPAQLFPYVHVARTTLEVAERRADGGLVLLADFEVRDDRDQPVAGAEVFLQVVEWVPGGASTVRELVSPPADSTGRSRLHFPASLRAGLGGRAEVIVDRRWDRGVRDPLGRRLYFFPADGEHGFWAQVELP